MSTPVVLPALGESVTEGTVTRWLKQVGDTVQADEGLLEISTDKVDTEIPSPVSGVIEEILVAEDETVEVGALLAKIGDGSAVAPAADEPAESEAKEESEPAAESEASPSESAPAESAPAADDAAAEAQPEAAPAAQAAPAGDAKDILLPELGESVTEGTVTRWLKQIGDEVAVDEPLLEISTDKVDTEIPSPVAGVLQEILAAEDETVEVGSVLARVGSGAPAEAAPAEPAPAQESAPAPAAEEPAAAPAPEAETAAEPEAAEAAPAKAEPAKAEHAKAEPTSASAEAAS